jgi:hypothetical protein
MGQPEQCRGVADWAPYRPGLRCCKAGRTRRVQAGRKLRTFEAPPPSLAALPPIAGARWRPGPRRSWLRLAWTGSSARRWLWKHACRWGKHCACRHCVCMCLCVHARLCVATENRVPVGRVPQAGRHPRSPPLCTLPHTLSRTAPPS